MAAGETSAGGGTPDTAVMVAEIDATAEVTRNPQPRDKSPQRVSFRPAGTLFSPAESLAWVLGLLGAGACIAPWLARGWLWLELIATAVALLACYDAVSLWLAREDFSPVLLPPETCRRGRPGQTIQVP